MRRLAGAVHPPARSDCGLREVLWYNRRWMSRRSLSLTLLAILAVQLLGGVALASVCVEPCPDDTDETSCPPICALCTSCTHAWHGIVRHAASGASLIATSRCLADAPQATASQLASDIFHVPLAG